MDSGSDVMTVRKEVLETLDTEFLGTIQSRGIHATRRKQLHRCRLQIGAVQLETDVSVRRRRHLDDTRRLLMRPERALSHRSICDDN